jgi:predicted acylesterase/phospholipase RssA
MEAMVLPVSGGGFPAQLGLIQALLDGGYSPPHLVLASSGGNVAAYVAAMAGWNVNAISRVSKSLTQDLFIRNWIPFPLHHLFGFFQGSLYRHGNGADSLLSTYSTQSSIQRTEIWTGCYNSLRKKAHFFCNRSADSTLLDHSYVDEDLMQCLPPTYLDGDMARISTVGMASASIPTIVPPVMIDGEPYVDGGLLYASPLTALQDALLEASDRQYGGRLHLTYVNSFDLQDTATAYCLRSALWSCSIALWGGAYSQV